VEEQEEEEEEKEGNVYVRYTTHALVYEDEEANVYRYTMNRQRTRPHLHLAAQVRRLLRHLDVAAQIEIGHESLNAFDHIAIASAGTMGAFNAGFNRPISVYRLGEMPIQSCGQSVSARRGKEGARLNAHTKLRAKRQRSAREAIYRNRPTLSAYPTSMLVRHMPSISSRRSRVNSHAIGPLRTMLVELS